MDKIYRVFISSTYEDLIEERKEVTQALLEMNCFPTGMELFQASNDTQWELIKRVIDSCDYYIVIIAGRYGSIHEETKKYNGPRNSDHGWQKDREHGRISESKERGSEPWHEQRTARSSKQNWFWRY